MIGRIVDVKGRLFNPPEPMFCEERGTIFATQLKEIFLDDLAVTKWLGINTKVQELRRLCGANI